MPSASTSTARKQKILSLNRTRRPTRTSWRNESKIITNFLLLFVNDPAIPKLNDAFAVGGVFLGVRDLHDCHALLIQLTEEFHNFFALAGMQVAGRFVGQQNLRFSDDRARNAYQLLLSAGELTRI